MGSPRASPSLWLSSLAAMRTVSPPPALPEPSSATSSKAEHDACRIRALANPAQRDALPASNHAWPGVAWSPWAVTTSPEREASC